MSSSDASASSSIPNPARSSASMSSIVRIDAIKELGKKPSDGKHTLFVKSSDIREDGDVIFKSKRSGVLYNTVLGEWWEIYEKSRHDEKDACVEKIAEEMIVNRGIRFLSQEGKRSDMKGYRVEPKVSYKVKKKVKRDIRDVVLQKYSELGLTRKQILLREEAVKQEHEKKRAHELQQRRNEQRASTSSVGQSSVASIKSKGVKPTDGKIGLGHLVAKTTTAEEHFTSSDQSPETQAMLSVSPHAMENGTTLPVTTSKTFTEPQHHHPALPSNAPFSPFMGKTPVSFEEVFGLERQCQGQEAQDSGFRCGADASSSEAAADNMLRELSALNHRDSLSTVSKANLHSETESGLTNQEIAELGELLKVEEVSESESSVYIARKTTTMTNTTTVTRVHPDSFKFRARQVAAVRSSSGTNSSVGGAQNELKQEPVGSNHIARQEFEIQQRTSERNGKVLGKLHSSAGVGGLKKRSQFWAEETASKKKRSHSLDAGPLSPISEPAAVRSSHVTSP